VYRSPHHLLTMMALAVAMAAALLGAPQPVEAASPARVQQPAWYHWIGWSTDGRFAAWRQGHSRQANRPGTPVWLARVQSNGTMSKPDVSRGPVRKALANHGIRGRIWVWRDQVSPVDVLLRTREDVLLAVVVRSVPPVLAVLRKWRGEYEVVARRPVPGPVVSIDAQAFESSGGDLIAVLARTHTASSTSAWLFTLPLAGAPPALTPASQASPKSAAPAAPPAAATPTAKRAAQTPGAVTPTGR